MLSTFTGRFYRVNTDSSLSFEETLRSIHEKPPEQRGKEIDGDTYQLYGIKSKEPCIEGQILRIKTRYLPFFYRRRTIEKIPEGNVVFMLVFIYNKKTKLLALQNNFQGTGQSIGHNSIIQVRDYMNRFNNGNYQFLLIHNRKAEEIFDSNQIKTLDITFNVEKIKHLFSDTDNFGSIGSIGQKLGISQLSISAKAKKKETLNKKTITKLMKIYESGLARVKIKLKKDPNTESEPVTIDLLEDFALSERRRIILSENLIEDIRNKTGILYNMIAKNSEFF